LKRTRRFNIEISVVSSAFSAVKASVLRGEEVCATAWCEGGEPITAIAALDPAAPLRYGDGKKISDETMRGGSCHTSERKDPHL